MCKFYLPYIKAHVNNLQNYNLRICLGLNIIPEKKKSLITKFNSHNPKLVIIKTFVAKGTDYHQVAGSIL